MIKKESKLWLSERMAGQKKRTFRYTFTDIASLTHQHRYKKTLSGPPWLSLERVRAQTPYKRQVLQDLRPVTARVGLTRHYKCFYRLIHALFQVLKSGLHSNLTSDSINVISI